MVTVGVANGQIAYVSSSLTQHHRLARRRHAHARSRAGSRPPPNVGRAVAGGQVGDIVSRGLRAAGPGSTVPGFAQEQQVRLRALALADGSVRPVIEANVVDVEGGAALAYTLMVDAVSGKILHRAEPGRQLRRGRNVVQRHVTAHECGPQHPFELTDDRPSRSSPQRRRSRSTTSSSSSSAPAAAARRAATSAPAPRSRPTQPRTIPAGIYHAQVCPFDDPTVPVTSAALRRWGDHQRHRRRRRPAT